MDKSKGTSVNFLFDGRQVDILADEKEKTELEAQIAEARSKQPVSEELFAELNERLAAYREKHKKLQVPLPWAQHRKASSGNSIDVFAFSNLDQLHATLMHELGHALGLGHLPQSGAIMNEIREVSWADVHLSQFDVEAALSVCERR